MSWGIIRKLYFLGGRNVRRNYPGSVFSRKEKFRVTIPRLYFLGLRGINKYPGTIWGPYLLEERNVLKMSEGGG